ncbi:MAG: alpha/beta hydrolase [Spirochaetia bacterium]|nr:alpha/beta hydrolase [Spirochaetia bacterium]
MNFFRTSSARILLMIGVYMPCFFTCGVNARTEESSDFAAVVETSRKYYQLAGLTYRVVNGQRINLDVFRPRPEGPPMPALVYIHGGGWMTGDKERAVLHVTPFLANGWVAFNVEYRLGNVARAPAGAEDCICALKWIFKNAATYRADMNRVVLMGHSAGGHLALLSAFAPEIGKACPGDMPKVRAIVNWYGISDVADLIDGANRREYAEGWIGNGPGRMELANRLSPIRYIRAGLPAVIAVHGDQDDTVPFAQSVRLDEALRKVSVPTKLIRIPGAKHGQFSEQQYLDAYRQVVKFVDANSK